MVDLAPENQITWKGKSEEIKETSNELFIIFALALLTAYLVMAATFNSFIHPFIIILTVPLAIFGGLVFILFLNSSVNIFSQIALIILIGISTKNSILIVDYANQIRSTGKTIELAVKEACAVRFRPIIMTSLKYDDCNDAFSDWKFWPWCRRRFKISSWFYNIRRNDYFNFLYFICHSFNVS